MMNYLKKFESFQTNDEIHKICEKYKIKNYTINENDSIDVDGNVNLSFKSLTRLPINFNKVNGDFYCSINELTTLKGAPVYVDGDFVCSENKLTTLLYSPNYVNGDFNCYKNNLTTLEGAPNYVSGYFRCSSNKKLKSLNHLSKIIDSEEVYFEDTGVYRVFELLDDFSLSMIRNVNDLKVIFNDEINIEILNAILYDLGEPQVDKVEGYISI